MNDPRLDRETAERLLRGEYTGPTELADLLAAASTAPVEEDPVREEAAVAAFRDARSRPRERRPVLGALLTAKAALIALLLAVGGGIAVAAASQHLPFPAGHEHSRHSPAPRRSPAPATATGSPSPATGSPPPAPVVPPSSPGRAPSHGHPENGPGNGPKHSPKPHPAKKHPKKTPAGRPSTHRPPGRSSHGRA